MLAQLLNSYTGFIFSRNLVLCKSYELQGDTLPGAYTGGELQGLMLNKDIYSRLIYTVLRLDHYLSEFPIEKTILTSISAFQFKYTQIMLFGKSNTKCSK